MGCKTVCHTLKICVPASSPSYASPSSIFTPRPSHVMCVIYREGVSSTRTLLVGIAITGIAMGAADRLCQPELGRVDTIHHVVGRLLPELRRCPTGRRDTDPGRSGRIRAGLDRDGDGVACE